MGLIYKITCSVNSKVYVGQTTKTLAERWMMHLVHVRTGRRCALQNSIRKHGVGNFKIELIEQCSDEALNNREVYWISILGSAEPLKGYNRTQGGSEPITNEVRHLLSVMRKGAGNPMFGKKLSAERRRQMSITRKGRTSPTKGLKFRRGTSKLITAEGFTLTMAEWARRTGIPLGTIFGRLKAGWSDVDAISKRRGRLLPALCEYSPCGVVFNGQKGQKYHSNTCLKMDWKKKQKVLAP